MRKLIYVERRVWIGEAGFTLIELLVCLVLVSLLLLMATQALQVGIKVSEFFEQWDSKSRTSLAYGSLNRILSEIRPVVDPAAAINSPRVFFEGNSNAVRFVAPLGNRLGLRGLYEIALYLKVNERGGTCLEIAWRPFKTLRSTEGVPMTKRVLVGEVTKLELSYFGFRTTAQSGQWYRDWHNFAFTPELIRLRLQVQGADWPDLIVAPMARRSKLVASRIDMGGVNEVASSLPLVVGATLGSTSQLPHISEFSPF